MTNKMLGEELALLVEARQKRAGKQITIAMAIDTRLKSANKGVQGGQTVSEVQTGYNFTRRSKSNNGQTRGGIITGEMTVEQAAQLLHGSPQIFMRRQINDPYFAPIVTGQGIYGVSSNPALNLQNGKIEPQPVDNADETKSADLKLTSQEVIKSLQQAPPTQPDPLVRRRTRQASKLSDDSGMDSRSILYDGMSKRMRGDYPATTLAKPELQPFKHLRKCTINQTIQKVNQVVLVLFKQKMKIEEQ